ncbi:MAG: hypothetical protein QOI55_1131, partial [Actinomycetota bacterium]|nr:hypothetical protein [Actinomycetota bacterium]
MSTTTTPTTTPTPPPTARSWDQFLAWSVIVVPIGAWTVHMIALASLVRLACEHPGVKWVMHGLTVGLSLVCIGCLLIARRYARLPNGEDAVTTKANLRFLSHVGLAVAASNLLLIALEG